VEQNKVKKEQISEAREAIKRIPQGLKGKVITEWKKNFDPNDPMLSDWQKIKVIGTDAQLLNTAKTKGAISDREMELFAKAAANDDLISAQRLTPVLDKLERFIAAEESSLISSYKRIYGEDPESWGEIRQRDAIDQFSFQTEDEAMSAGLPSGTIVMINGRKARID
jgi:hypothetical protein